MIRALAQAIGAVRGFCTNPIRIEQAITGLKACTVIGVFGYFVYFLHIFVYSVHISQPPLSLAVAFLTAQAAAISSQLAGSCLVKKVAEMNSRTFAERAPMIRERLAAYAVGEGDIGGLRTAHRVSPRTVEQCLRQLLGAVQGESKRRLSDLTVQLGILASWQTRARSRDAERRRLAVECFGLLDGEACVVPLLRRMLNDRSPMVRSAAFRALLHTAGEAELLQLFSRIGDHPFLVRVFATGEIRNRAFEFDLPSFSRTIDLEDSAGLIGLLSIAEAWRRPLPPEAMPALLIHRDPRARSAAIRLAPASVPAAAAERWTLEALQSEDDMIRRAGLAAAARLSLASALPLIQRCAESANFDLASLACITMSQVGPDGRGRLESMLTTGSRHQAAFAAYALSGAALAMPFAELQ